MGHENKGSIQITINDTLTLPKHKPDIEFLLRVTSTPFIHKTTVADKKIIFSGHLLIGIEYVACVPDCSQPMHFVSFEVPFNGFINCSQAKACMNSQLNVSIEFQEFQAMNQRTINKLIIVKTRVLRLSKIGECPSQNFCQPHSTICKLDKPIPCNESAHPCHCPPEPPKQKCYIPASHDCEPLHHHDCDNDCNCDDHYEDDDCTICGCSNDRD